MIACWSAALGILLLAQVPNTEERRPLDSAARKELQKLQGAWQLVSLEQGAEPVPPADFEGRSLFIGAESFVVRQKGGETFQVGTLKLGPSRRPKTINVAVLRGENAGEIMLGIYELVDDTLRVCLDPAGQDRPAEFTTAVDSKRSLATYRRRKTDEPLAPEIVGRYQSETVQSNGTRQLAEAIIERYGEAYRITYKVGPATSFIGVGIRQGDGFSVCYLSQGQAGISVYHIEKGGKLVGRFTQLGGLGIIGEEVLTPMADGE